MVSRHKQKNDLSTPAPGGGTAALVGAVLAMVTLAAYWPVLGADFVNYDDPDYVTENPHVLGGLTLDGVTWAFTMDSETANWHPLTFLSHMLDCELFGKNAGLHHLTNLIIHTASAVVLLWVLTSMTGQLWPSAFVAAAFALHPLHVESVAWVAERKDVLSGLFWMLTMACYLRYTRTGGRGSYGLTMVVFALGLMAKPMLVTLPFVLLLLDYWPLKRFDLAWPADRFGKVRSLVVEKIPFFALTGVSCIVTFIAQKTGGAVRSIEFLSFGPRLSNAMVSYAAYIAKMVWPVDLAVLYPFRHIPPWQSFWACILVAIITAAAVLMTRRKRYVPVGWFWYLGTLVPVIGLVQVGAQRLADRYSYLPLTGLFMIAAWVVSDMCRHRKGLRFVSIAAAMLLIGGMFAGTRHQLRYWKDSIALFRRAIEVTENNSIMHNNLGSELLEEGHLDEAIAHFRRSLQIHPDDVDAYSNLGAALAGSGHLEEAITCYRQLLEARPECLPGLNNLAWFLATAADPALRDPEEAVHLAEKAYALMGHENATIFDTLSVAYASAGRFDEAVSTAAKALELARAAGNATLEQKVKGRIKLFKAGQRYIEQPATEAGTPEK
ncbi:MAG: tetratricopeptide repeat protein [Planctomycetota bacterium]|jgi:tetratricopeptide (TPR) repeat protein